MPQPRASLPDGQILPILTVLMVDESLGRVDSQVPQSDGPKLIAGKRHHHESINQLNRRPDKTDVGDVHVLVRICNE